MRQFARLCVGMLILILTMGGCAHHRIVVPEPTPGSDYHTATLHAFLWGAIEETHVATECARTNVLDEVRVRDNLGFSLAAVLTLGLWLPTEVEYKCGKIPVQPAPVIGAE